ncbi:MAG: aldo/keto reductase [Chloroflexi bacterium]|nr:aldo/keto reductase [Chloroflexota bacterium]MBV9596265.1 aldo/keto reductase [Chloroflexota bacterium]
MIHRPLGGSGIDVSILSLGSWLTFERLPRDTGLEIMRAARRADITFLDDARYNDPTGSAPLETGYSEVVFGELFRAAGWERQRTIVANKLWFEFWPEQDAAGEIDASLQRLGFDYLDLEYCAPLPASLAIADAVSQVGGLIQSGKLRAWGVLNWSAAQIVEAHRQAVAQKVPPPCAAQLPYSLARREPVETPEMIAACQSAGVSVVASSTLASGVLTGKYAAPLASGRVADQLGNPRYQDALRVAERLQPVAARLGKSPAAVAIAYALTSPRVASVLFGATRPDQIHQNCEALGAMEQLSDAVLDELRAPRA